MLTFTKQERTVVSLFISVLFLGTILEYSFKKYPFLADAVNLIDSDRLYSKIDINTASIEELIDIPYIGEYTASNIIRYRQMHGPFLSVEQVKNVKGIRDKNYQRFYKYLMVDRKTVLFLERASHGF